MATYWENSCSFGLRYVSWYKYLIVSLVFSHLGFWSGNLFLIAPFPDLCLLVPFCVAKPKALISFAVTENKGADQLRSYCEADLRLCFRIGKGPVFSRCSSEQRAIRNFDQDIPLRKHHHRFLK